MTKKRWRGLAAFGMVGLVSAAVLASISTVGTTRAVDAKVRDAEKKRVAVIKKVSPAVVAVILQGGRNGGSGVLIDDEGYALTNFHVTEGAGGPVMKCGLADGVLYDAVLVGLDKVGDVALIKLLPKKPGQKFPFVALGDSDKVRAGDWSLAMGNPFLLATDFTPTVTFGLISGVHRYQYPAGTLLEYTDCIQIDTSINPGNSGGPLFNMDGELIGINGRGSFEKRGRVNSGVGYAISINQIKNFLGQLRAGMDTDHASLGAKVESESEEGGLSRVLVRDIIDSDARRRGLEVGDQLMSFAGRPVTTVNQYKNVLGLYPKGWRVPIVYRHENARQPETLVRLMGVQRQVIEGGGGPPPPRVIGPGAGPPAGPAAALYKAKAGFANYYFNDLAQKKQLDALKKNGDFSKLSEDWSISLKGDLLVGSRKGITGVVVIKEKGAADGKTAKVIADIDALDFSLEPLSTSEKSEAFKDPPDSGGLLLALYQYRQMLVYGLKGFVGDFSHGGTEPFYPPPAKGTEDIKWGNQRVDCDVLRTKHAGVPAKWYFAREASKDKRWEAGQLIGFEVTADRDEDPCEVYLAEYKDIGGGQKLPTKLDVRKGDKWYGRFEITKYTLK